MYDKKDYGASGVDGMRRCNYELFRVRRMRKWLTVMNAIMIVSLYDNSRFENAQFGICIVFN